MGLQFFVLASAVVLVFTFVRAADSSIPSYIQFDSADLAEEDGDLNDIRTYSNVQKRAACVPRGDNCDHRPNDCCLSTSCRCNLWGANCRCQRKGIPWLRK